MPERTSRNNMYVRYRVGMDEIRNARVARLVQLLDNLRYFAFLPHMAFKKQVGERGCARPAVARRHKHNGKLRHFVDAVHGKNGLEAR